MGMRLGNAVTFPGSPGIGRVAETGDHMVRVDFFESAAASVVGSVWMDIAALKRIALGQQTRVFFQDSRDRWRAGRVVGGGPDVYFVRVPNLRVDVEIPEESLRVRWEKTPPDPMQVLLCGAAETPRYRDVREPVRRLLLAERAATGSATGIISAGVRMHAHQINAALRVIRDPVQRYLLADEVGMGKTIQAGLVMRQLLIDAPGRQIGVIVPDALITQWQSELRDKFFLDDFPTATNGPPFEIVGHSEPQRWAQLEDVDLLVVDEAHLLARTADPGKSPYRELAQVSHAVPRVLMLSATPFSREATTHLALLHLLDPQLFRWEDRERFEQLLGARRELALAVFGLDEEPDPDNPGLLDMQFAEIRSLIPNDEALRAAMGRAMDLFGPPGTDPASVDLEGLRRAVTGIRTHVSETYRLHQRVIRNRRRVIEMQKLDDDGLLTPFRFTGRTRPRLVLLQSEEADAGATAIEHWIARCAAAILDSDLPPEPYGRVLGILMSRVGGPVRDLWGALAYRVKQNASQGRILPAEESILGAAPLLDFEEAILDALHRAMGSDGLDSLASAIAVRCAEPARSIIFCGRGTLAADLVQRIPEDAGTARRIHAHLSEQTEAEREAATEAWRCAGGLLVVDDTGDVGRNFQEADLALHVRLPWNPNAIEQRIGRVDRYGNHRAARQFVIGDANPDSVSNAWLKILVNGFEIFSRSVSTLQEMVDELAANIWTTLLRGGVEEFLGRIDEIRDALLQEERRINELDALESSFETHASGEAMALAIARYEDDTAGIERSYRQLIEGVEGYRFASRENRDGSVSFGLHEDDPPLLSTRLLRRLMTVDVARTGFFDRWTLTPGRRLFRRGNPFIDGIETLLSLDDRGCAVAMWRLDQRWPHDPLTFFGFDFLIETDLAPLLNVLAGHSEAEPIARRRADAALPPQQQRVWVPVNAQEPTEDPGMIGYLSQPFVQGRDVNLNYQRIGALHALLGGDENLAPVAEGCFAAARKRVEVVSDVVEASKRAACEVRRGTEVVLAQSRARSRAAGLVGDPRALEVEVAMGRAIEAGVTAPLIRLSGVSCVVVSAQPWRDYVER